MKILSHALVLAALNNLSPVITFAISIFIARLSSVEALANYYALQSVYPLLLFVFNIAPYLSMKMAHAVVSDGEKKILPIQMVIIAVVLPTLMLLTVAALAPLLAKSLHITSSLTMVFFALIVFPAGALNFLSGILLSIGKHLPFALKDPIYVLLKLSLMLFVLINFPTHLWLLFASEFLAYSVVAAYVFSELKSSVRLPVLSRENLLTWSHFGFIRNDFAPSLFVAFILSILAATDTLYVKANFSETVAGVYSIHSMIAKVPYFVSTVAVMFILSNNASRSCVGIRFQKIVRDFLPVASLAAIGSMVLFFYHKDIASRFYGLQPGHDTSYFSLLLIHSNLIAVVQLLIATLLNRVAPFKLYLLGVPILFGAALFTFHRFASPVATLEALLLIDLSILVQGFLLTQWRGQNGDREERDNVQPTFPI